MFNKLFKKYDSLEEPKRFLVFFIPMCALIVWANLGNPIYPIAIIVFFAIFRISYLSL
jgi:hypothetical protein